MVVASLIVSYRLASSFGSAAALDPPNVLRYVLLVRVVVLPADARFEVPPEVVLT
jgi:hypothetical protein